MTYALHHSIVDFEFPGYEPVYPIKVNSKPVFTKAQFQGEIEQVVSFGENQLAREFVVEYNVPLDDANIIDNFLATVSLYNDWFFWDVGDISGGLIKVTCEKWTKDFFAHNRATVKATFVEAFDFLPRNYGLFSDPPSYLIRGIDSQYSFGYWVGGSPPTYELSFQDADLQYSLVLVAELAAFGIDVLPAGPEIYVLDIEDSADFSIVIYDSDYVIGTASESDYFASMSAQVYGWDRDFQVDWWGD